MVLEGKCVVVTGGGWGIGRGLVAGFTQDGADVFTIGRTEADLAETQQRFGNGRLHYVVGDIARQSDVERLFASAEERHGKVDILINNAAVYPKVLFLDSDIEQWAEVIEINVVGMARCCHRALPGMLERGYGRIVNLGSWAWKGPIPTASAYSASKGAVRPLTKAIACEIDRAKHPDVLVNELLPGTIRTRMTPDQGDDPVDVYARALKVVSLEAGGPSGQTFAEGELLVEDGGIRARLRGLIDRVLERS
jgi:NAD(P)-dependent dehydrogenase (short-subunit alcohol dehydrogenase family)